MLIIALVLLRLLYDKCTMYLFYMEWANAEIQDQSVETAMIMINIWYIFTPTDLVYATYLVFYSELSNEP